jgi:hypothetical protein
MLDTIITSLIISVAIKFVLNCAFSMVQMCCNLLKFIDNAADSKGVFIYKKKYSMPVYIFNEKLLLRISHGLIVYSTRCHKICSIYEM